MRHALRGPLAACLFAPLLFAAAARAQSADPFAPATRWSAAPPLAAPWMPVSVDFAARGELVFAAGALSTPTWMVFSSPAAADASGHVLPLLAAAANPAALSGMSVRCGENADALFALAQIPDPDAAHRRTEVSRFDALSAAGLAAAWTHDLGWRVNGGAKLAAARDGSRVVALVDDAQTQRLRLEWLDAATGAVVTRVDWTGGTLRQLAASSDVSRVAIVAGLELWVLDSSGATLHHEALAASTQALALSGDGRTLLVGAPGALRVLQWSQGAFALRASELAAAAELPVRCALSDDGATWAAAWWNANTGRDVRMELRGAPADALVWQESQTAPSFAPQNLPEAVCIARDGSRAAYGLWGSSDAQPEVLLVDRALATSIVRLDLPGSVLALALDTSATRLAIAMKHAHANQFATTGEVRLFDTGARDVQALDQAHLGQTLHASARASGAHSVWFLYGPRAANPRPLSGVSGILALSRQGLHAVRVNADATGRADADLPVPAQPALLGVPYSVQALFRSPQATSLSSTVLDPIVL